MRRTRGGSRCSNSSAWENLDLATTACQILILLPLRAIEAVIGPPTRRSGVAIGSLTGRLDCCLSHYYDLSQ